MKLPTATLAEFLRAANKVERQLIADRAQTTVNYLYQLASTTKRKVPSVMLAFDIEDATRQLSEGNQGATPIVTARELSK